MKNTLRNSLLFVGLLLAASLSFGQTYIKFTTLASAVTSSSSQSNTFSLTSVSGITANNTMLFIEGEADFVNAVNTVANTVSVTRGAGFSTRVSTHPSGATVWYSYPYNFQAQTPIGYPFGSCTRANLVLPYIDVINNVYSDCLGGVWVRGISAQTAAVIFAPNPGGSVLTGVGTSTATTNTSLYCTQIFLPYNKKLTGLGILNGATVTNGHREVLLYDAGGNLLAQSGTTTTTAGASTYQQFAFTAPYFAVGPAWYVGCSQAASSSDTLNLITTAYGGMGLYTEILTSVGTYPQSPATITVPSAFTTEQGPFFQFY